MWSFRFVSVAVASAFLPVFLCSIATAQPAPSPPGRTLVPSGGGITDGGYRSLHNTANEIADISEIVEFWSAYFAQVKASKMIEKLRPEIQSQMPQTGGVLVRVGFEGTPICEGAKIWEAKSVRIVGPYASKEEALRDAKIPSVVPARPTVPSSKEAEERAKRMHFESIWIPAPLKLPPNPSATEIAATREKVTRLLELTKKRQTAEAARLEIEWAAISKENERLNELREKIQPEVKPPTQVRAVGERAIAIVESQQRTAIENERDAAQEARITAEQLTGQLTDYVAKACQFGERTYGSMCDSPAEYRATVHRRYVELTKKIEDLKAQAVQHDQTGARLKLSLRQDLEDRRRALERRVREAEKVYSSSTSLGQASPTQSNRLQRFKEDDEMMQKRAQLIEEMERILKSLDSDTKR